MCYPAAPSLSGGRASTAYTPSFTWCTWGTGVRACALTLVPVQHDHLYDLQILRQVPEKTNGPAWGHFHPMSDSLYGPGRASGSSAGASDRERAALCIALAALRKAAATPFAAVPRQRGTPSPLTFCRRASEAWRLASSDKVCSCTARYVPMVQQWPLPTIALSKVMVARL